jgi:hypothetical protein
MATISDPNNAVQQLAYRLNDPEDPDDDGFLAEAGKELLDTAAAIAAKVRQTNTACKGSVTITFKMHASRTANREVKIEIEPALASKKPMLARPRKQELYAGHEGDLSTLPVQEDMGPLFTKESARAIEGGKSETKAETKGKKAL